jgi:hypothetical protein
VAAVVEGEGRRGGLSYMLAGKKAGSRSPAAIYPSSFRASPAGLNPESRDCWKKSKQPRNSGFKACGLAPE